MKKSDAYSLAAEYLRRCLQLLESGGEIRSEEEVRRDYKQTVLMQILSWRFKTNDFVVLIPGRNSGRIRVNAAAIDLDAREFLVLKAIAAARSSLGMGAFVPTETIMRLFDDYLEEAGLADRRLGPTADEVRRIVLSIRDKFSAAGINRQLIESRRPNGYRLSAPFVEILTENPPEGGQL